MRSANLYSTLLFMLELELCFCELFTSVFEVESLLEKRLADTISAYIEAENTRLELFRQLQLELSTRNNGSSRIEDVSGNPLNLYFLIKRRISVRSRIESLIKNDNIEKHFFANELKPKANRFSIESLLSSVDFSGVATAIFRLQDAYELSASEVASGRFNHRVKPAKEQLSVQDCFDLGKVAHKNRDYYHALMWMQESLNRIKNGDHQYSVNLGEIIDYLTYAMYEQGNPNWNCERVIQFIRRSRKPSVSLFDNLLFYRAMLNDYYDDAYDEACFNLLNPKYLTNRRPPFQQIPVYEALCRGDYGLNPKREKHLDCKYYQSDDEPFTWIARYGIETMHLKPRIVIYRNVLLDSEIQTIKRLALPRLAKSGVVDLTSGKRMFSNGRTSKIAWLNDGQNDVVRRLTRRIEMLTGLSMDTAENLQVASYGLGGHYEPHHDFQQAPKPLEQEIGGNRIATWLSYMSTPEAGGATVFTQLNLTLWATKHDAAFWYNLRANGEGDNRTEHAACPVLAGVKWASNKWIHEYGQEFRRPCGLNPSD